MRHQEHLHCLTEQQQIFWTWEELDGRKITWNLIAALGGLDILYFQVHSKWPSNIDFDVWANCPELCVSPFIKPAQPTHNSIPHKMDHRADYGEVWMKRGDTSAFEDTDAHKH